MCHVGFHSENVANVNFSNSSKKFKHVYLENIPNKRINDLKILGILVVTNVKLVEKRKTFTGIALKANGKLIVVDDNYQIGDKLRSSYDFDEENFEVKTPKPISNWKQIQELFSVENNILYFDHQPVYIRGNEVNCSI